jgi:hypothetical protein
MQIIIHDPKISGIKTMHMWIMLRKMSYRMTICNAKV